MFSGLDIVIFESSCLTEPAAAFRGLANKGSPVFSLCLFSLSKSPLFIITSPRTSSSSGRLFPMSFRGMVFTVFKFWVTSSPTTPSPLVEPTAKVPLR